MNNGYSKCANCRFWGDEEKSYAQRNCKHPALHNSWEWPFDDEVAKGNGDSTGIRTGAKFSCPHWEQNVAADEPK